MVPFFLPHGVYSLGTAIVLQQSPTPGDHFLSHRLWSVVGARNVTGCRRPGGLDLVTDNEVEWLLLLLLSTMMMIRRYRAIATHSVIVAVRPFIAPHLTRTFAPFMTAAPAATNRA